jgi:hypothetical protein
MCLGTYIIIALAFYVYPDEAVNDPPELLLAPSRLFTAAMRR